MHMEMRAIALGLCALAACASTERSGAEHDTSAVSGDEKADEKLDAGRDDASLAGEGDARGLAPSDLDASSYTDAYTVSEADAGSCGTVLHATIRDFRASHADFENRAFISDVALPGIVKDELGADRKPVYAATGATRETTGPSEFAQWYNDVPGVNMTFSVDIALSKDASGKYVYDSQAFFPIDDKGPNEATDTAGKPHNYHFTTEIHTRFDYRGGEVFTFLGDDDVWVFINHKLAIDLGGLHRSLRQSVDLDAATAKLGITRGQRYDMDIFHAERMATESNFRIETTIDCLIPSVLL
jgi:fibro-slime domain-containing protein